MIQEYQKWKKNILPFLIIITSRVILLIQRLQKKNQLTESGLNEKTKSLATKEKMKALAIKVELKVGQDKK